jgi:hypothetical protein
MIGGAVKERKGADTVDRQDFSEEVCGLDKKGRQDGKSSDRPSP